MSNLTLSQALRSIARLKGKLAEYRLRAQLAVTYRSEAKPAYVFQEMCDKARETLAELIALETRVAITNATTGCVIGGERTLAEAIRTLQEWKGEIAWLKTLAVRDDVITADSMTEYGDDGNRKSVKISYTCDLPVAKRNQQIEKIQEAFDALNDLVEKTNHSTLLVG